MTGIEPKQLDLSRLPPLLAGLKPSVRKLFGLGADLEALLARPKLAIVGSRKMTPYGLEVTDRLTTELAREGVVIISGLAMGIDGLAHRTCVKAGGQTIAVVAHGLDYIHPASHSSLAETICQEGGAVVSEYPVGTPAYKEHFVARNRIIAGLAEAVLIPEAAAKSGSLYTADFALELGKPVLAVPGNITAPLSEGCNNLIKHGATPVTCVQDIYDALNWAVKPARQVSLPLDISAAEAAILHQIRKGVAESAALLRATGLATAEFQGALTMLELNGHIKSGGPGLWHPCY